MNLLSRYSFDRWLPSFAASVAFLLIVVDQQHLCLGQSDAGNGTGAAFLKSELPLGVDARLVERFESEIHTLMTREDKAGCLDCHDMDGDQQMRLSGQPLEDLFHLIDSGWMDQDAPDGLLGRLTSETPGKKMPKGRRAKRWTAEETEKLREFLADLEVEVGALENVDQRFPVSLRLPYSGPEKPATTGPFLRYSQLRGKVRSLFGAALEQESDRILSENVTLFGGADFKTRFNETSQPTSGYLTGLDQVSRDLCTQAFLNQQGPFAGWDSGTSDWMERLRHLYQSFLFRDPTHAEVLDAESLFQRVFAEAQTLRTQDYRFSFEAVVTDAKTGWSASKIFQIPVDASHLAGGFQQWVDQSSGSQVEAGHNDQRRQTLNNPLFLEAGVPGRLTLWTDGTRETVSFAGVELRSRNSDWKREILADDPSVSVEGAWKANRRRGYLSFEDEFAEKGRSYVNVALEVDNDGLYDVSLIWRNQEPSERRALVEVFDSSESTQLVATPQPQVPQAGFVEFEFDGSEDTRGYVDAPGKFRFHPQGYVEIHNTGTDERVTVSQVEWVGVDSGVQSFDLDSQEAEGIEGWPAYDPGSFEAYNKRGTQVHDENKNKGERSLRFHASASKEFDPDQAYRVRIWYPGKRDHERHTPTRIAAWTTSPILQVSQTLKGRVGGTAVLDLSQTYTPQRGRLSFKWKQLEGPPVEFASSSSRLEFNIPKAKPEAAAWIALSRALMRHPDFLYTRAPSLDHPELQSQDRDRLLRVRLALDLVGRPPTQADWDRFEAGESYEALLDNYLHSEEFAAYYFHRIRLYLESQGTPEQDEPARIWTYVMRENLPFQEILTGNYSVDTAFQKQERPDYHGNTGVLTTPGFIQGKPGLPHYNYAAQVSMLFLGYVFEVPPEALKARDQGTALSTTDPDSSCYSCHKILTPLARQRLRWTDAGKYRATDSQDVEIDDTDRGEVHAYPFKGRGMEAFASQAALQERFVRTMIDTHFQFYFGRAMRFREDERELYSRLWNVVHEKDFKIRELIRAIALSPEYLAPMKTDVTGAELELALD